MPRVEDIAWKFVIREGNNWRCPYCGNKYTGHVTRVRSHLLKQSKDGISSCKKVPELISTLMDRLRNHQVRNKDDIAWKFVDRLEDNKWRCPYCSEEFSGDLTGVKGHLLKAPNEGISICTVVPDPVRTLMRSLLDEVAEEEGSREANSQTFTEPQSRDMPTQAEVVADEEGSREANVQSSTEPQTRDMPTQAEVVAEEEESREANVRFSTEPPWTSSLEELFSANFDECMEQSNTATDIGLNSDQQSQAERQSRDMQPPAVHFSPTSSELVEQLLPAPEGATDMENFTSNQERQLRQSITMPSLVRNSHGESISCSEEEELHLRDSPYPEETQTNDQHTVAGASLFHYDQLPAVGYSNCLQDCNQHSQLQPPMDIEPSIAPQHTSDSHISEATIVDSQVRVAATNAIGPSSSQVQPASVPPQHQSVPHQSINLMTTHVDPCIPSSSQAPNNAPPSPQIPPCGTSLVGQSPLPELDMNEDGPMTSHPNTGNNLEENEALKRKLGLLYSRVAGIRDELEFAASISIKKQRREVENWLPDVEKFINVYTKAASKGCLRPHQCNKLKRKAEDLLRQGKFPKGLFEAREAKFSQFSEVKMVGDAFQRNTTEILEHLEGNQVSLLGIYGMGGVGKTTIMKHIHNRLEEKENCHVLWITVSQDFNTQKLQDDIWEALDIRTLHVKDVSKRAAMLSNDLTKRGKSTMIIDDVWEHFDLEEVGIPVRADGFKLVLTTRSFDVCCQMRCQKKIKIEPLSQEEAESLFMEELGSEVALNLEIEAALKSIVNECAGLPLGVVTMARSMRGVTDVFEWKDSLVKLRESDVGQTDMEKKVLMKLKFSYDHLGNHEVQQCFLSCALYPEHRQIDKFELIEFFIDQGLIGGLNTRERQYNRGLTILNKLGNVCLLEDHGTVMKMHDLIRDTALHIMSATSIVEAGKRLTKIPPEEYWTDAVEKVSLMENNISKFPLNMSPNCVKLSTCLLNRSLWGDVVIPDSFFKQLWKLKVLNLSGCELRELPNSISDLVELRALLLRECQELRRIPYLGKLKSLRKLDIRGCACLEALEGLEMLVNLRYIDLTGTRISRLTKGTLGGLLNLQYLKAFVVNVEDITNLWALETLECCFEDVDGFNKCVGFIKQISPRYYELKVDQEKPMVYVEVSDDARFWKCERRVDIREWSHAIVSMGGESSGICILIPQDVQTLIGRRCDGIKNLSVMGSLENLEELNIVSWKNLWVLCGGQDEEIISIHDSPAPTPTPLLCRSLRELVIYCCPKLKYLFGHGSEFYLPLLQSIKISFCEEMLGITAAVTSPPPHPPPAFPSLEKIEIECCLKMKRVVECEWLPHFSNLRVLTVDFCPNVEEVIGGPPPYMPVEEISLESLVVGRCGNMMRKLIPHELLNHLRNLENIRVDCCRGMVEMISKAGQGQEGSIMTPVNNTTSSFQSSISLPKLKRLYLHDLPQLKSICEVPINCDSMDFIGVYTCPKLKRIPLQLRFHDDIKHLPSIEVESEEIWKTLIWDDPNAQAILQPYLKFSVNSCVLRGSKSVLSGYYI